MKSMLAGLRADGEEGRQVEALTQLCEMLSIGTEDSLAGFSVDSFVPVLVGLLNHESNPDIMLLAARALTHLCDVLPSSCSSVVHYGAVACFCARLLTIEYMDLAEQVRICCVFLFLVHVAWSIRVLSEPSLFTVCRALTYSHQTPFLTGCKPFITLLGIADD
jgi:hypothetical protein